MQALLNSSRGPFSLQVIHAALVHELTPLLSVKSCLIGKKRKINARLQQKAVKLEAESTDLNPNVFQYLDLVLFVLSVSLLVLKPQLKQL